jgi:uncharacterized membrane protein
MVSFVLLTWIAGRSDRAFLVVHVAAAMLLLGVAIAGVVAFTDRAVTMGALAAAIVLGDLATVAWIGRRSRTPRVAP